MYYGDGQIMEFGCGMIRVGVGQGPIMTERVEATARTVTFVYLTMDCLVP